MDRTSEIIAKEKHFFDSYLAKLTPDQKAIYDFSVQTLERDRRFMDHVHAFNTCEHDAIADNMYETVNYKMCMVRTSIRLDNAGIFHSEKQTIFDIGCGGGYFSYIARLCGHIVYSLDIEDVEKRVPLFDGAQKALDLTMIHHTIMPYQPLPDLPDKCSLCVAFQPHFYRPTHEDWWDTDKWAFFLQDITKVLTPHARLFFDLNKVLAHPELYGFGTQQTKDLFLACGARAKGSKVFFDSAQTIRSYFQAHPLSGSFSATDTHPHKPYMYAMTEISTLLDAGKVDDAFTIFDTLIEKTPRHEINDVLTQGIGKFLDYWLKKNALQKALGFLKPLLKYNIIKQNKKILSLILEKMQQIEAACNGFAIGSAEMPDGHIFMVRVKPVEDVSPGDAFIEHVFKQYCLQSADDLILTGPQRVLHFSKGKKKQIPIPMEIPAERIRTSLTLANNEHLLFSTTRHSQVDMNIENVYIYDNQWKLLHKISLSGYPPYGSQSIGQSYSGVLCYGEYASASLRIRIWRSVDFGRSWKVALELPGMLDVTNPDHVRHFHVCQPDPYLPWRWYAFTGDRAGECHCYLSDDDGATWTRIFPEVHVHDPELLGHQAIVATQFLRTTAVVFDREALYFATDDSMGGQGPVFVRMGKQAPFRAEIHALPSKQHVRSLVDLDNGYMLAITQKNPGTQGADIMIVDKEGNSSLAGVLPVADENNPVTTSYQSRVLLGGRFYTLSDADLPCFPSKTRALCWEVTETTPPDRLSGCTWCDPAIRASVLSGKFSDMTLSRSLGCLVNPWEYECPKCASRTRIRTLIQLMDHLGTMPRGRTLAFAASQRELDVLNEKFAESIDNVALHERAGSTSGYDMRHLPTIKDASYLYVYACCVVDYIPEQHLAAREMYRILQPGGHFLFNVMPWRTNVAKNIEPRIDIIHFNALAHESYSYQRQEHKGSITLVPEMTISQDWVITCMLDTGFAVNLLPFWDPFSQRLDSWIHASKPARQR